MKILIKEMFKILAFPFSFIVYFFYKVRVVNFKTSSIILSKIPGFIGIIIRQQYYNLSLNYVGDNLRVFYGSYFVYPNIEIGNNCTIEENCVISLCSIGDDVIIAANVSIMSGNKHHDVHDISKTFYNSNSKLIKVKLGDNLWIGVHSVIMANVSSHSAVGAGSVVTKQFPEYMVIAGVPAKVIKKR